MADPEEVEEVEAVTAVEIAVATAAAIAVATAAAIAVAMVVEIVVATEAAIAVATVVVVVTLGIVILNLLQLMLINHLEPRVGKIEVMETHQIILNTKMVEVEEKEGFQIIMTFLKKVISTPPLEVVMLV